MNQIIEKELESVVIRFAGDSGDGMQLTGTQFTNAAALFGNDLATFPDFPAEIRAPQGTLAGVSGFQIHFGSTAIHTPGDQCDVLVAMNVAALKANIRHLKTGGVIIANSDGFDAKNMRLANVPENQNPLTDGSLAKYDLKTIDVTKITRSALADSGLGVKEIDRCKNMFVLGLIYWMYNRSMDSSINFIKDKFRKKEAVMNANLKVLQAGWNYGETTEMFANRFKVAPAKMAPGVYRSVMGNEAAALGLVAASQQCGLPLFYGTYPITPASDILHELSKYKHFDVKTFQAEDEIAGICSAIGAAFGGNLAITGSSGPGIALKTEAIGLATMLELPLVVVNIQRAGPSTGMPTKTEQADLLQSYYGRNGECPVVIVAAQSPADCFEMAFEACRIALNHMIPVFFLSDGYIANGAEPWRFPKQADLPKIPVSFASERKADEPKFMPYERNEKLGRPWAIPGTKGLEHRIGGIEKQNITGNISYDPVNHEQMVHLRQEKVDLVANYIPEQTIDSGPEQGDLLMLGWGGTYGALKTAAGMLQREGYSVAHAHVRYLSPFPKNLGELLSKYKTVVVPELNNGQLVKIIRDKYYVDAIPYNKIQGQPFMANEVVAKIKEILA
ncbi:MAG: 2-oxoacid:acceptor oxidoreductase subunit alpha [Bacteroidetes bacterium]|nr:2-oxoacid:acceptor oxidoreductase subunit alpha [Bacteroidota bacterium]MCK6609880.1 2-oxoacid:acceptor oxidoreductase subunit alpha [Bacteroidia bacterium]